MSILSKTHWCGKCGGKRNKRVHVGKYMFAYLCDTCDYVYIGHLYDGNCEHMKYDKMLELYGEPREKFTTDV